MDSKIAACLVFKGNAEEALNYYVSLFPDCKIRQIERYPENETGKSGTLKHAVFLLQGVEYMCIDSASKHEYSFTPTMTLQVICNSLSEIQALFKQLSEGGKIRMELGDYGFSKQFGWVEDKFGVSWQLNLDE